MRNSWFDSLISLSPAALWMPVLMLIVAGCVSQGRVPEPAADNPYWAVIGRISIRSDHGTQAASLRWEQRGRRFDIRLAGPAGRGAVLLTGDDDSLRIEPAGADPVVSTNPEQLMREHLGWAVPLGHATHWIRGRTGPGATQDLVLNGDLRPVRFKQVGFDLEIEYPRADAEGGALPVRITARRAGLLIVVRLRRWQSLDSGLDSEMGD